MTWEQLSNAKYVLLTTFKKDGTPVGTPVWVAPDGQRMVVWTNAQSWKVKRIRRNRDVTVQLCDNRGRPKGGRVFEATARVLDGAGTEQARSGVARKYGVVGKIGVFGHKLLRGAEASVGIAITPKQGVESGAE